MFWVSRCRRFPYRPSRFRAIAPKWRRGGPRAATSFASTFDPRSDQGLKVASLYVTWLVIADVAFDDQAAELHAALDQAAELHAALDQAAELHAAELHAALLETALDQAAWSKAGPPVDESDVTNASRFSFGFGGVPSMP